MTTLGHKYVGHNYIQGVVAACEGVVARALVRAKSDAHETLLRGGVGAVGARRLVPRGELLPQVDGIPNVCEGARLAPF